MWSNRRWAALAIVAVLALVAAACGGSKEEKGSAQTGTQSAEKKIVVGSTNFSEQLIVAEMYAKMLEHHGFEVTLRPNLGTREVVQPALEKGEIDLVPEYVGTLLEFLQPGSATADLEASADKLRQLLHHKGLTALKPAEAEDANAIVVTEKTATEKKLHRISDLSGTAKEMVLGGPPECPTRPLCLPGLRTTYGLEFKEFKPLDAGGPITREALQQGQIDVAVLFSSDGAIAARGFKVLEDDQNLQPAENIIPVIRTEKLSPELDKALTELSEKLTTEELTELNKRVSLDKEDPAEVAETWLKEQGLGG